MDTLNNDLDIGTIPHHNLSILRVEQVAWMQVPTRERLQFAFIIVFLTKVPTGFETVDNAGRLQLVAPQQQGAFMETKVRGKSVVGIYCYASKNPNGGPTAEEEVVEKAVHIK